MYDDYGDSQFGFGGFGPAMGPLMLVLIIILFSSSSGSYSSEHYPTYDKVPTEQAYQNLVFEKSGGIVVFAVSNFDGPNSDSADDAAENIAETNALVQDWKTRHPTNTFICETRVMRTQYKNPVPLEVWAVTASPGTIDSNSITRVPLTGFMDEGKGIASFSIVDDEGGSKSKEGFVNNRNLLLAKVHTWLADNPSKGITGIGVDADSYGRPLTVVVQYGYK